MDQPGFSALPKKRAYNVSQYCRIVFRFHGGPYMTFLKRAWLLLRDDSAQAASEYALLSMVIALGAVTAMHAFAVDMNHALLLVNRTFAEAIKSCLPPHHGHP
jgi:Flp pilus assembly pilin Flp